VALPPDVTAVGGRSRLLLWPAIAVVAMFVLGWAVGKGSTPLDNWFHEFRRTPARWLLFFTDPWVLAIALMFGIAVARYLGRRRLAAVMLIAPLVGIVLAQVLKRFFGRQSEGDLAYPSGHTTTVVIVMGMLVLLAGAVWWSVVVAAVAGLLAMIGQGVTYHYFTDTIGAALLGSAVVCVAALAAGLDTRQPGCDEDHTGG
jgi:membrane-associated phospholipid phosphatase